MARTRNLGPRGSRPVQPRRGVLRILYRASLSLTCGRLACQNVTAASAPPSASKKPATSQAAEAEVGQPALRRIRIHAAKAMSGTAAIERMERGCLVAGGPGPGSGPQVVEFDVGAAAAVSLLDLEVAGEGSEPAGDVAGVVAASAGSGVLVGDGRDQVVEQVGADPVSGQAGEAGGVGAGRVVGGHSDEQVEGGG